MDNTYFGLTIEMKNKETKYVFDLNKHKNFIQHIEKSENECAYKSYGQRFFSHLKNERLFSDDDIITLSSIVIVIPLKYFGKKFNINDPILLNECIGHAFIFYDKIRDLIYISNLCIHQHISKNREAPKLSSIYLNSIGMSNGKVLSSQDFTYDTLNSFPANKFPM
jgi:hypothetical protein